MHDSFSCQCFLTNCMQLTPPREANNYSITQEIPAVLWNLKYYHNMHSNLDSDKLSPYPYKRTTNQLHGLSPRANYTDRATAACRRTDFQLLRIKGATWSA
jgi:hypothetical protein